MPLPDADGETTTQVHGVLTAPHGLHFHASGRIMLHQQNFQKITHRTGARICRLWSLPLEAHCNFRQGGVPCLCPAIANTLLT